MLLELFHEGHISSALESKLIDRQIDCLQFLGFNIAHDAVKWHNFLQELLIAKLGQESQCSLDILSGPNEQLKLLGLVQVRTSD